MPITPVPTGEPISTGALTAIATILSGLFGLFRGGGLKDLQRGFVDLSSALSETAHGLLRFAWRIARALGWLLRGMQTAWVRVLRPLLEQMVRLAGRVRRLLERDLPRLIRLIERIRRRVLDLYERYTRPMLIQIQRIRRMLIILRLFRVKWAEQLDARLVQVQERLLLPIRVALAHLAIVELWLNAIVTAEQLFQETIWGRSAYNYQDPLVRSVLSPFLRPFRIGEREEQWPRAAAVTPDQTREHLRMYLVHDTGPIADDVRRAAAGLARVR